MIEIQDFSALQQRLGQEIAVSDWFEIAQDAHRRSSPRRPRIGSGFTSTPRGRRPNRRTGTTIAHGFLTLSLVSALAAQCDRAAATADGDQLRPEPRPVHGAVPSGSRIRGRFVPSEIKEIEGGYQVVWTITIEREGSEKPSCVAEWVLRYLR